MMQLSICVSQTHYMAFVTHDLADIWNFSSILSHEHSFLLKHLEKKCKDCEFSLVFQENKHRF